MNQASNPNIDSARLTLLLNDLRLPAIKEGWTAFAQTADKEGWPAARFLATLAEHELAERDRRRIERHLGEARLLLGKTLDSFEFEAVPMISKAHIMAICAGDTWIDKGANLILIGGLSVISCVDGRFNIYAAKALIKRSPKKTANWALAIVHSRNY